jgi:primosomal protein N''
MVLHIIGLGLADEKDITVKWVPSSWHTTSRTRFNETLQHCNNDNIQEIILETRDFLAEAWKR